MRAWCRSSGTFILTRLGDNESAVGQLPNAVMSEQEVVRPMSEPNEIASLSALPVELQRRLFFVVPPARLVPLVKFIDSNR